MSFVNLIAVCIGFAAATRQVKNGTASLTAGKTAQLEKELDMILGRVAEIKEALEESKAQPADEVRTLADVNHELAEVMPEEKPATPVQAYTSQSNDSQKEQDVSHSSKDGQKILGRVAEIKEARKESKAQGADEVRTLADVNHEVAEVTPEEKPAKPNQADTSQPEDSQKEQDTSHSSKDGQKEQKQEPFLSTKRQAGAAVKAAEKQAHTALRGDSADLSFAKHQAAMKLERFAASGMDVGGTKVKIHTKMKSKVKKPSATKGNLKKLVPADLDNDFGKVVEETEKKVREKLKKEAWKEKQAWHKKQKEDMQKEDLKKLQVKEAIREADKKVQDTEKSLNMSFRARHHAKIAQPTTVAPKDTTRFLWKVKPFFPAPENATNIAKEKKVQLKEKLKAYKKQQKKLRMHKVGHELAKHARHPEFHEYDMLPVETRDHHGGHCDSMIPASNLGLKRNKLAAHFWQNQALLQTSQPEEDGNAVSLANPGAGSVQIPVDHGRSIAGQVNVADETMVEPYVRVFKDGFYRVRCTTDLMYWEQDKYSYGKFRYKEDPSNISIVMYREMVVDSEWKAMTPIVCFEFCRTIPDMVFFGLIEGRECYCTPYYKPPTKPQGMEDNCDIPCEGDETTMCGGKKKSLMFEMHFCADTAGALAESAMVADEMLSYMYDTAFIGAELTANLFDSGKLLKEYAGLSGLPDVADMGLAAEQAGMDIIKATVALGCLDDYRDMMTTYKEAKDMRDLDFTLSPNLQKADDARAKMKDLSINLDMCTKKLEEQLTQVYPLFHSFTELEGPGDLKKAHEQYAAAFEQYYPLLYVIDKESPPKMSTCEGDVIGQPAVLTLSECSAACNSLVYPQKCMGYQFFQLGKSDELGPICFLFSKIKSVTSFECPFVDDLSLLQSGNFSSKKVSLSHTSAKKIEASKLEPPICEGVRQSAAYSGLTCSEFFPADSVYLQTCPDTCARTEGALLSATCQVKLSESTGISVYRNSLGRCFGVNDNKGVDLSGSEPHTIIPVGDNGPIMEGTFEVGTYGEMEDPADFIWTRK